MPQVEPARSAPGAGRMSWSSVPAGTGLAIFDLDRTLIQGSSLVPFGRELVRRRIIPASKMTRHALTQLAFEHRGLGDARVERLAGSLLRDVTGMDATPLIDAARQVAATVADAIHPTARWLVERHLDAGDFCVIVSASPQELVESVAATLGMHRGIGTRLGVVDGRFTGLVDGSFCYGPAKLTALERQLGHVDLATATAYADSASDLPLLRRCGLAVAVNPDAGLLRAAVGSAWPVVRF